MDGIVLFGSLDRREDDERGAYERFNPGIAWLVGGYSGRECSAPKCRSAGRHPRRGGTLSRQHGMAAEGRCREDAMQPGKEPVAGRRGSGACELEVWVEGEGGVARAQR